MGKLFDAERMELLSLFIFLQLHLSIYTLDIDDQGYILYCPCMGRFGNQADHFLGALGFAHGINRTLVLPPWVEYRYGETRSIQIPFSTYFKVEPLLEYHKVITMEDFMSQFAPTLWPPEKRVSFCYMARGNSNGCNAKEGNPFGPFWDTFNVDFVDSQFYGPLNYDVYNRGMDFKWRQKYPAGEWPVLAFTGAPASFPVQIENRVLHKYLKWNDNITAQANNFIKTSLPKGSFIGIHLRNGMDWIRACEHIKHSNNLFASPQCLGYRNEKGVPTMDMCLPPTELIIRQLKRVIKNFKDKSIKSVFVASDSNHMLTELNTALKRMKVSVFKFERPNPHVELAIMGRANYFIGNCISSFSAFVKRERDSKGFPSGFWAFPTEKNMIHEEL